VPWRAFCAEPPKNEFTLAKNSLTKGARSGLGHIVPLDILDVAAAVADEVVMTHDLGVESCGAALDSHFPHQTRLHQVPQIVISGRPGTPRIYPIHSFEDFRGRGMPGLFHEECHHGKALWRTPQPGAFQGLFNRLGVHDEFRLSLK
jgi:hypothetical protein